MRWFHLPIEDDLAPDTDFEAAWQQALPQLRELLGDNGLGMFRCRILADGDELATANVSVFEPPDALAYLESTPQ